MKGDCRPAICPKVIDAWVALAKTPGVNAGNVNFASAKARVEYVPGVADVETVEEADGARALRAILTRGASGQEALKAAFLGGLDVRSFSLKEPTLHDAFIALTGDHPDQDQSIAREPGKREMGQ